MYDSACPILDCLSFSNIPVFTHPHSLSHHSPTPQQAEEDAEEERRRRDQELEAADVLNEIRSVSEDKYSK